MAEQITYHQRIALPYRYTAGEANAAFLRALSDRVILGSRCESCRTTLVPARPYCPTCSGATGERIEVAQEGRVVAATTKPSGRVVARIRLDGTDSDLVHVVAVVDARSGMRVRARWAAERPAEITAIEAFEPA